MTLITRVGDQRVKSHSGKRTCFPTYQWGYRFLCTEGISFDSILCYTAHHLGAERAICYWFNGRLYHLAAVEVRSLGSRQRNSIYRERGELKLRTSAHGKPPKIRRIRNTAVWPVALVPACWLALIAGRAHVFPLRMTLQLILPGTSGCKYSIKSTLSDRGGGVLRK